MIFFSIAIGALAGASLLHSKMLRDLAQQQLNLHNDVEFLKSYLKETATHE